MAFSPWTQHLVNKLTGLFRRNWRRIACALLALACRIMPSPADRSVARTPAERAALGCRGGDVERAKSMCRAAQCRVSAVSVLELTFPLGKHRWTSSGAHLATCRAYASSSWRSPDRARDTMDLASRLPPLQPKQHAQPAFEQPTGQREKA